MNSSDDQNVFLCGPSAKFQTTVKFSILRMKLLTAIVTFALSATCPFALAYGIAPALPQSNGRTCVVKAIGKRHDDVPNILKAFNDCNNGGRVVFPETEDYWIGQKLNPILSHVTIEWRGKWTVCIARNFDIQCFQFSLEVIVLILFISVIRQSHILESCRPYVSQPLINFLIPKWLALTMISDILLNFRIIVQVYFCLEITSI